MENKMKPIVCERDLEFYERNIRNMNADRLRVETEVETRRKNMLGNHLMTHKGKLVKVETVAGNCLKAKVGLLLEVGADFIVLKIGNSPVSTVIPINSVHFITIVHDNNRNRIMQY